jgi:hypothetical protein
MAPDMLNQLYKRTRTALEELKAASSSAAQFDPGKRALDGNIAELEMLLNELLGRMMEQAYELDRRGAGEQNKPQIFELITDMSLGKSDPFGKSLGPVPLPGAKPFEASIYFYWWRFLRLSKRYKECIQNGGTGRLAKLYQDFGDIHAQDFEPWWHQRGRSLFSYKFETDAVLDVAGNGSVQKATADRIILSVPLDGNTEAIIDEVKRLLRSSLQEYKNKHPELAPKYVPKKRYDIHALHNKAEIYDAAEYKHPDKGHLEIYSLIRERLTPPANAYLNETQKRKFISAELGTAKLLIKNVELGRFPDFSRQAI